MVVGTVNFSEKSLLEEKAITYSENSEDFAARDDIKKIHHYYLKGKPFQEYTDICKALNRASEQAIGILDKAKSKKTRNHVNTAYSKRLKEFNKAAMKGENERHRRVVSSLKCLK